MSELHIDWHPILSFSEWFFLGYFISINTCYLILNLIALFNLRAYMPNKVLESLPQIYSGLEPPALKILETER